MSETPIAAVARNPDGTLVLDPQTRKVIFGGVLLGLFVAALDQTVVATALPRIVADLHGIRFFSAVLTAYLLTSTAMVPICGRLSDVYGRKAVLVAGVIEFLVTSMLCGLAPNIEALVAFRALQGVGAAALTSAAFTVPVDLFSPSERARSQGLLGACFGLANVVGPLIGGGLTDTIGWRWTFYINIPLGLIALFLFGTKLPKYKGRQGKVDYLGGLLLLLGITPLLLALSLDHTEYPWFSPMNAGLIAVALVGLVLFIRSQVGREGAILPMKLFRLSTFSLSIAAAFAVGAVFFTVIAFLPLFLINSVGVSAMLSGTTLLPLPVGFVFSSIVSGRLVEQVGKYKKSILFGTVLIIIAMISLSSIHADSGLWWIRLKMLIAGLGFGPTIPLLNLAIQNSVPVESVGAATASRQFFQQLGMTFGAAIFGAVLAAGLATGLNGQLTPIREKLPAATASQLTPDLLIRELGRRNLDATVASFGVAESVQHEIHKAVAGSFATSVDKVYLGTLPLAILALFLVLLTPEQRIRRWGGNQGPTEKPTPGMLLELKAVTKSYYLGKTVVKALGPVSVGISPGEFTAFVGPSGSGKTTLLNIVGCLDHPETGAYFFREQDVSLLDPVALADLRNKEIGFIFQNFNLVPTLNVAENIELPAVLRSRGESASALRKRASELAELVGLGNHLRHRPDELSGGQRQRVAIARALINNPPLVIADEPTANLDHENAEQILDLMTRLNRERGVTFIFSTHDPQIVSRARRVVRLRDGVLQEDTPAATPAVA